MRDPLPHRRQEGDWPGRDSDRTRTGGGQRVGKLLLERVGTLLLSFQRALSLSKQQHDRHRQIGKILFAKIRPERKGDSANSALWKRAALASDSFRSVPPSARPQAAAMQSSLWLGCVRTLAGSKHFAYLLAL